LRWVLPVAAESACPDSVQTAQEASGHQPILQLTAPVAAAVLVEQTARLLLGILHTALQAVFMAAGVVGA
jgi:hypothetical protein